MRTPEMQRAKIIKRLKNLAIDLEFSAEWRAGYSVRDAQKDRVQSKTIMQAIKIIEQENETPDEYIARA